MSAWEILQLQLDPSLLRTVFLVPAESPYTFFKIYPLMRTTDSFLVQAKTISYKVNLVTMDNLANSKG